MATTRDGIVKLWGPPQAGWVVDRAVWGSNVVPAAWGVAYTRL